MTPLYFKDGTLFSHDYIRVEDGGRGKFVELSREMLAVKLVSKFKQDLPNNLDEHPDDKSSFWYFWCNPENRNEKIYWQIRSMNKEKTGLNYAVYHRNLIYISPSALMDF